jgi:hypothetical protein
MVVSRTRLVAVAVIALFLLGSPSLAACTHTDRNDHLGPTTSTTLFPSQRSFEQDLSGNGYQTAVVFAEGRASSRVLIVWVSVDTAQANRPSNAVIFDHAVALAEKYGAANFTGGRLRVGLFELSGAGSVKDRMLESRDFGIGGTSASVGDQTTITTETPQSSTAAAPALKDGAWDLQVDRQGGSEDPREAFGFLPEANYHHIDNGPSHRVVLSESATRVVIQTKYLSGNLVANGRRTSVTDGRVLYELGDGDGRFVVWQAPQGPQGEFTLYGSGRPIISSERGVLSRASPLDSPATTTTTSRLDGEGTTQAKAALQEFLQAWAVKDLATRKAPLGDGRERI